MSYQEESLAPPATLYAPAKAEPAVRPSDEQQAVRDRGHASNVLVAAAGSGKTRVLTWLYTDAHLQAGIPLQALLAITFTDKAAGELRHRISSELAKASLTGGVDLTDAWIGTFHGICMRILREFAHRRGLDPAFGVIEELQALELQAEAWDRAVKELLDAHGGDAASLIAQLGDRTLRSAIIDWWTARRSSGEVHPELPTPHTSATQVAAAADELLQAIDRYSGAIEDVQSQRTNPLKSLVDRLAIAVDMAELAERARAAAMGGDLEPPTVGELSAGLEACKPRKGSPVPPDEHDALIAARDRVVRAMAEHIAGPRVRLLADLVRRFSLAYEAAKRRKELLDFDDLELEALQLLREDEDVRRRLVDRFERILVDEFQDTNPRQAELVDYLAGGPTWIPIGGDGRPAVTVVGDPRQAIYGFRHADVQLIGEAADRIDDAGTLRLTTNYRSDAEVLTAIDDAFAKLDPGHEPVSAHRGPDRLPGGGARVELLITKEEPGSKDAPLPSWADEALGASVGEKSGAALAEARLIAARIKELRAAEPGGSITVLGRARSVLGPIAESLADLGIPALIDGAEGFWERLEVLDVLAWLRLVRNPADDASLVAVCASPLVGLSTDAVAQLGLLEADRRHGGRLAALRAALATGDLFTADDARRLRGTLSLLDRQRLPGRSADPAGLIDELLLATGYDEHLLRLMGGDRRAANVVRLRRLATNIAADGGDLTDVVERAEKEVGHELRAPEASVAGSDAVTLMTVHQSKGLEFDTVIVAGLGSRPRLSAPALIGAPRGDDGRLGLRLRPSPGAPLQALFDHDELTAELRAREEEELRRVLYVALTRARERLIVSGLARWTQKGSPFSAAPSKSAPVLTWLAPAMIPELESLIASAERGPVRSAAGIELRVSTPDGDTLPLELRCPTVPDLPVHVPAGPSVDELPPVGPAPLTSPRVLSYSALASYSTCALRFYAERVLGLRPPKQSSTPAPFTAPRTTGHGQPATPASTSVFASTKAPPEQPDLFAGLDEPVAGALSPSAAVPRSAIAAGTLGDAVHGVLERLEPGDDDARSPFDRAVLASLEGARAQRAPLDDLVRAATLDPEWDDAPGARDEVRQLVQNAMSSATYAELWAGGRAVREAKFTVTVGDGSRMIGGSIDAWTMTSADEALIVDYKTNAVAPGQDLSALTAEKYGLQQQVYALAALRSGARRVRIVHLYLRLAAGGAVESTWEASDEAALDRALAALVDAADGHGTPRPTDAPNAMICDRCQVKASLCRWSPIATERPRGAGPAPRSEWRGAADALLPT
ncbi:MAG: UvrD-helicase domain-containing protein [Solirubrobacteraceae bacterium]|nr:UvrD-helicase domain-containing protein [Solirubrobacteraceae bacterium]